MKSVARSARVGFDNADKIPLVAQYVGKQTFVRARPSAAYAVERTHYAVHAALSHRRLECAQVQFARALFVEERGYAVTVAFLIVEREMFGHDYNADVLNTFDLGGEHKPRQNAVLAVVLPVSAAVRGSVYIRAGGVHDNEIAVQRFVSHCVAHSFHKLQVPSGSHDYGRGERKLRRTHARRSVGRFATGRAYARCSSDKSESVRTQPVLFLERQLIEQIIPHRIVVFEFAQHRQIELAERRSRFAVNGKRVVLFHGDFVTVLHISHHHVVYAFKVDRGRRVRSFPIVARQIFYRLIVLCTLVKIEIRIVETVGYFLFGFGRGSERFVVVRVDSYFINLGGIARSVHSRLLLGREIFSRKNVIERVVRVRADGEIVIARFEYVRFLPVRVVCAQILSVYRNGQRLFSRLRVELIRLGKTYKLHRRFFYAVLSVVIGIRSLNIHLHNVLAGISARIAYLERHVVAALVLFDIEFRLLERSVRETVSERERNFLGIIPCRAVRRAFDARCAVHAENGILVARFIVSVSDVNAFLIHEILHIMSLIILRILFVEIGQFVGIFRPRIVAEIRVGRRGVIVIYQRVGGASRYDVLVVSGEYVGNLSKTHRSALTDPYARIHTVFVLGNIRELHGIRCVQKQHNVFDLLLAFENIQFLEHARFLGGKLEIILSAAADGIVFHYVEYIEVLARRARDYHYRRIVRGQRLFRNSPYFRIRGFVHLKPRHIVGRRRIIVSGLAAVRRFQLLILRLELVVYGKALALELRAERARFLGDYVHLTGSRTREHIILRRYAEHAHARVRLQRQRVALVPQQNAAFYRRLLADTLGIFTHRRIVSDRALIAVFVLDVFDLAVRVSFYIVGFIMVEIFPAVARLYELCVLRIERFIQCRGVFARYARADCEKYEQQRKKRGKHRPN